MKANSLDVKSLHLNLYLYLMQCSSLLTLCHNHSILLLYRDTVLTLRPGESSLRFVVGIFNDVIPEIDENFDLRLANPSGGVTLGPRQSVSITVLNNDNAHGLIGFAEVLICI